MNKLAYFFIDDTIWVFRDLARQRPTSLFDNAFLKMLKRAHDDYELTVQLNVFYRTDFFYGSDEFTLAEMPDIYKAEFEANADWLRLAFHAKQEFPDYPYVNATYEDVKKDYEQIVGEIKRFAGEASLSHAIVPHWLPVSKAGCQALADCGVQFISPTYGDRTPFTGDQSMLPYGHAQRLLHNRQPETCLFTRKTRDKRIVSSIAAYNHVSAEIYDELWGRNASYLDAETGLRFRVLGGGPCINLNTPADIRRCLAERNGDEFIGVGNHEQYFYKDYFAYIPDIAERICVMAETLHNYGYRFITADDMK